MIPLIACSRPPVWILREDGDGDGYGPAEQPYLNEKGDGGSPRDPLYSRARLIGGDEFGDGGVTTINFGNHAEGDGLSPAANR